MSVGTTIQVPFVNLGLRQHPLKAELLEAVESVLDHGSFILSPEVQSFERHFAELCGTRYTLGVASGTDALILTLREMGIGSGDEVITVPNSFLASASAVALVGARPVFVDVREDLNINPNLIEAAITPRTRAVIVVHLTGRPADMYSIMAVTRKYDVQVIEDCAQAVGARYHGKPVGAFDVAGCFSFHPLKTLGACGDGGAITTNDASLYERLSKARNHGLGGRSECEFWSYNSRLDSLQAALLSVKLRYLDQWTMERRAIAAFYREQLANVVRIPDEKPHEFSVYHTFVVQADRRDDLQLFLDDRGIGTRVHYSTPLHLQEAARYLGYRPGDFPVTEQLSRCILSLPIYPELTYAQREAVVAAITSFYH